jgi:hypothetical protein
MAEAAAAVKEWDYGHNLTLREVAAAQRELDESQVRCVASWGVDLIHHAVICLERIARIRIIRVGEMRLTPFRHARRIHPTRVYPVPRATRTTRTCGRCASLCQTFIVRLCQILPLPICRYRFKFQSNLVWDSIKSISNFCFQF